MVSKALRLLSFVCIAAVVGSFAAFASDQAGSGSRATVARLASGDSSGSDAPLAGVPGHTVEIGEAAPRPRVERVREREHGDIREAIDDVNDVLTAPFKGMTSGDDLWSARIVQGLLALVLFGVGLGFLGRYAASRGV